MQRWFKSEMSLGNVITILVVFAGLVVSWSNVQSSIAEQARNHAKLDQRVERLEGRDMLQDGTIAKLQQEIIARLVRVETLIDQRIPSRP